MACGIYQKGSFDKLLCPPLTNHIEIPLAGFTVQPFSLSTSVCVFPNVSFHLLELSSIEFFRHQRAVFITSKRRLVTESF